MKLGDARLMDMMAPYWMLFVAVFAGGQVGSYMGTSHLNVATLRIMTALLVLYVAGQLLFRWYGMA